MTETSPTTLIDPTPEDIGRLAALIDPAGFVPPGSDAIEPYLHEPGSTGVFVTPPGKLREYILAARAKGLNDRFILFRHALRPSSLSLMTIVGINFGALLGGTVVIEFLFSIPGLGGRLINAITSRDILVIQGITVFIATVYVVINTVVDLFYAVIDPRIRKG